MYHLSVFPANRGVPRPRTVPSVVLSARAFQYSLRIVGFRDHRERLVVEWDSVELSVFPANRGVPRPIQRVHRAVHHPTFQYSLRIVGFRDRDHLPSCLPPLLPFSIPCESWGSATLGRRDSSRIRSISFSIPCESWGSATR